MSSQARKFSLMIAMGTLMIVGCKSSTRQSAIWDVASVAEDITKEAGVVQRISATGAKRPILIFEEVHTSRVGQIQIATMLLRLHDKYGLKKIALEGAIWSGHPLQMGWYQSAAGGQLKSEKEDLAVRMLANGEISSSELIGMLFRDAEVYGVEDANQYGQELNIKGSPEIALFSAKTSTGRNCVNPGAQF